MTSKESYVPPPPGPAKVAHELRFPPRAPAAGIPVRAISVGAYARHSAQPARVIWSCDVFVHRNAVMHVTDYDAGLYVSQYEPGSS